MFPIALMKNPSFANNFVSFQHFELLCSELQSAIQFSYRPLFFASVVVKISNLRLKMDFCIAESKLLLSNTLSVLYSSSQENFKFY